MSARTLSRWAALACAAMCGLAESPRANAQDAPVAPAVVLRLSEVLDSIGDEGPVRGRFRVRLAVGGADTDALAGLGLVLGDAQFAVTLVGGRFSGRIPGAAGDVRASVRARRGRVDAEFRGRTRDGAGAPYGARAFTAFADSFRWDGAVHGIEEATLRLGTETHAVAVGLAGESHRAGRAPPGRTGDSSRDPFHVTLVGIGRDVATPRDRADVQIVPRAGPRRRWDGRVRGHAFAVSGGTPALALAVGDTLGRTVAPADGEAADLGGTARLRDGVVSRDVGGATVVQVRFDLTVQAPPGESTAMVGVRIDGGPPGRAVRRFTAPANDPPLVLDCDGTVLEVRQDGRVWAWGDNSLGQVGNGEDRHNPRGPVRLDGPAGVVSVATGWHFSLAADRQGLVWLWGRYADDDGDYGSFPAPFPGALPPVAAVAAGEEHGLALDRQGGVWTFGRNVGGLTVDGNRRPPRIGPTRVDGLPEIVAIAAGGGGSAGLDGDGRVWAWGSHNLAGIGRGSTPVRVPGIPRARAVALTDGDDDLRGIVLAEDGTVWEWGGPTVEDGVPRPVNSLDGVVAVSGGSTHRLALRADGSVWVWGENTASAFGDRSLPDSETPVRVRGLDSIVRISAGHLASFAVDADGACWVFGFVHDFVGGRRTISSPVLAPR